MTGLGPINIAILIAYVLGMVGIGVYLARKQKTKDDYFLGGRTMPWLAVAMSLYASVTSAMTYMGLPGLGYRGNLSLLLVAVMSPLAAPVLIFGIYPVYRRLGITTSYEYIEIRFNATARKSAATLFMLARLGWLGPVIYAPSLALHVATGFPLAYAVMVIGALATLYCTMGGLRAVIWTDVPQFIIMIGGAIWILATLHQADTGGITEILRQAGLTQGGFGLDWRFDLTRMTATSVAIAYFFILIHDYGVDQISVQRLMAIRTNRGVSRALAFNAATDFVIIGLLLLIGVGLSLYYTQHPGQLPETITGEKVLPYFITHVLPDGLSGLLIAALFAAAMSSVDSGINAMSAVLLTDLFPGREHPTHPIRQARILTAVLGFGATGFALFIYQQIQSIVDSFYTFMGLFSAPVLGLFALGMMTRRATFTGWLAGAISSVLFCFIAGARGWMAEIYFFPVGTILTLSIGYGMSLILPPARNRDERGGDPG